MAAHVNIKSSRMAQYQRPAYAQLTSAEIDVNFVIQFNAIMMEFAMRKTTNIDADAQKIDLQVNTVKLIVVVIIAVDMADAILVL